MSPWRRPNGVSPWPHHPASHKHVLGADATLKINGEIVEYWVVEWKSKEVAHLGVQTCCPKTPKTLGYLGLSVLPYDMGSHMTEQKGFIVGGSLVSPHNSMHMTCQ